jgi:hypothetical protein
MQIWLASVFAIILGPVFNLEALRGFRIASSDTIYSVLSTGA